MKNNNLRLIALLAAGTLCITGCNSKDDSNNTAQESTMTSEEAMQNANEEIVKAVQATSAKVENSDLICLKGNAKASVDAKVDLTDLLPFISDDDDESASKNNQEMLNLFKEGISMNANANVILNADMVAGKKYYDAYNNFDENEDASFEELSTAINEIAETDKTQLYASIEGELPEKIFKSIFNTIEQTGNKYVVECALWFSTAEIITNLVTKIDDVNNTGELSSIEKYEKANQQLASCYYYFFNAKESASLTPEELPEGIGSSLELIQSYAKGEITNAQLVDQVVTEIKEAAGDDAAQQIDALITDDAKAYITSILDSVVSSNWGSVIKLGVDSANGATTYSYTVDVKALLTIIDNVLVTALTNSSNYPSAQLPLIVAAYIPTIRSIINAVMPTALNITESITIKDGIITKVGESFVANGTVNLSVIDIINQIRFGGGEYVPQFTDKKVTYNINTNMEFEFELSKTAFEIPVSPESI